MPLPLILGIAAGVAAAAGVGTGIHGGVKMKEANDTMKAAQNRHEKNIARFESWNEKSTKAMDNLGKYELEILNKFSVFSDLFEKVQNRPQFKNISIGDVKLPEYNAEELHKVSVGAGVILGGIGGAAAGTLGGVAAGGATTVAVMTLGTASTGTAIATLSGAAATNATLAALGGGSLAAGGLGIAGGTAVLGGATLGIGLLVGGIIFNATGCKLSEKADEAWEQMKKAEGQINKICSYLSTLTETANKYKHSLEKVDTIYQQHLDKMKQLIEVEGRTDWYNYDNKEQVMIENTQMLTGLLYSMCKVQLVLKTNDKDGINGVNTAAVTESQRTADTFLSESGLAAISPQQYDSAAPNSVVVFKRYNGNNSTSLAYLIQHRTGITLSRANYLLTTGGEIETTAADALVEDLKSYGIEAYIK